MTTSINSTPYLRTTRNFPQEAQPLAVEMNRAYLDTAEKVNDRTIGIYPTNKSAINGESWFITSAKQQGFRQVYRYTAAGSTTINHNLNFSSISFFSRIYGTVVDTSGNWYPLPLVDTGAAANQISLLVNSTQIVVTAGPGAPTISSGTIVLEWVSNA